MQDLEFVKFYIDNFISLPLKTKTDIQMYKLVKEGIDTGTYWFSDDDLIELCFNKSSSKNPALFFVYRYCRDTKYLFLKETKQ